MRCSRKLETNCQGFADVSKNIVTSQFVDDNYSTAHPNDSRRGGLNVDSEVAKCNFPRPFLKWPGGKRWLIEKYPALLSFKLQGRYVEPFVGGGSIFFYLRPAEAILSDLCEELISTYRAIRNQPKQVLSLLQFHALHHGVDYYYKVRDESPIGLAARAARLLYLNKTCFNGLYRVNRQGKFNVPIGSRACNVVPEDIMLSSKALKSALVKNSDFEPIIDECRRGDFAFVDPPYTVSHNSNGFIKYNEILFSWEDQKRLHDCLIRARSRGVKILLTNANHQSIRDLYGKGFTQHVLSRFSSVAASGQKRLEFQELLIQC